MNRGLINRLIFILKYICPLRVFKYTIIHLLNWHFSAWHLILSQTGKQSNWALPRVSKEVSPGRNFLIKVWFNENYESQKQLLQVVSNIHTGSKSVKVLIWELPNISKFAVTPKQEFQISNTINFVLFTTTLYNL